VDFIAEVTPLEWFVLNANAILEIDYDGCRYSDHPLCHFSPLPSHPLQKLLFRAQFSIKLMFFKHLPDRGKNLF
jgi:hypothetical protein